MKESEPKNPKATAFERTEQFLKAALKDQAYLKLPTTARDRRDRESAWIKQRNSIGVYFGSPANKYDVARFVLGVTTRESGRQVIEKGLKNLWTNCSPSIQAEYPWGSFSLNKPMSLKSRIQHSLSRGGKSVKIAGFVAEGKSHDQIREAGYSTAQISHSRKILSTWGMEVPPNPKPPTLTEQLSGPPPDFLPSCSTLSRGDLYKLFEALKKDTGFTLRGRKRTDIESLLKECPVQIFRYRQRYFYPADQEEALKEYLKSHPIH